MYWSVRYISLCYHTIHRCGRNASFTGFDRENDLRILSLHGATVFAFLLVFRFWNQHGSVFTIINCKKQPRATCIFFLFIMCAKPKTKYRTFLGTTLNLGARWKRYKYVMKFKRFLSATGTSFSGTVLAFRAKTLE